MLVNGEDQKRPHLLFLGYSYFSSFGRDAKMQLVLLLCEKFKNKAFPQGLHDKLTGCVHRKKSVYITPHVSYVLSTLLYSYRITPNSFSYNFSCQKGKAIGCGKYGKYSLICVTQPLYYTHGHPNR